MGIVDAILGAIGTILYPMFSIVFALIDGIQAIFQAFAGIGDVRLGGSAGSGGVERTLTEQRSSTERIIMNTRMNTVLTRLTPLPSR